MIHSRTLTKVCASAVAIGGVQLALIVSSPAVRAQTIQPSGIEPLFTMAHLSEQPTDTSDQKSTKNPQAIQEVVSGWSVYPTLATLLNTTFAGPTLRRIAAVPALSPRISAAEGLPLEYMAFTSSGTPTRTAFQLEKAAVVEALPPFSPHLEITLIPQFLDNPRGRNLFFSGSLSPVTTQTRFNEVDLYLSYTHELGPLDITVGNIAFFIDRGAETRVTTNGTFTDGDASA